MQGSAAKMVGYMEGADKRYIIPVYQRKYDWKTENCEQLFNDLKRIVTDPSRDSHFFGSIVSSVTASGSRIEFHIIDGQQRLTTVSLLMLAMCNLTDNQMVKSNEPNLSEQIKERFLLSKWAKEDDKIKLVPVKDDRDALKRLFDGEDFDEASNLTINYRYFCDQILKQEITIDELYAAIGKLEVISITLEKGDNAQLIFESLNSTGLALKEGDKIRNYVLMGLEPTEQNSYYDKYWSKIESCTRKDVSSFVRDYLSVKQQITPNINSVYMAFKRYADESHLPIISILEDLLRYARFYEKLLSCKSGLGEDRLDDCLYRMMRLEIVVTRPFLLEVLRLNQDGKLSVKDVLEIFIITENYLFRRNICDVPTNALNKIFLNLNKEILRYDNTADNYVEKFKYALLSKKDNARFPDDDEFIEFLSKKQVYNMRGKYKAYLFERFENYGTIEAKDVYTQLDKNVYTIEHIMPQTLSPAWTESLGVNHAEIHSDWLHRLANLTLTAYNPKLSNKPFEEKRDSKDGGYKASGLRMNQKIATKEKWGEEELKERNEEMVHQALIIWDCPETVFVPAEKEYDSCSLDDENYELTGRDIVRYSYLNIEQPVTSWADMFEHVVQYLHQRDKSVLSALAFSSSDSTDLSGYISSKEDKLRSALKVDENIYIEKNTNTALKTSILRRLFVLYSADPMDLVFYLKENEKAFDQDIDRHELRLRYWSYALPLIKERNTGSYRNVNPSGSNWISGFFGIGGFSINCVANNDSARVDFYMGSRKEEKNKEAFDILYEHKEEIEDELGVALNWDRADNHKASWITYSLDDVSIANEEDWPQMAEFHAEWSRGLHDCLVPYLKEKFSVPKSEDDPEQENRLEEISAFLREWASKRDDIDVNLDKCNRTYTRFTTKKMSSILPDIPDSPSGWNTDNHYFYEIINRTGSSVYIKLVISGKNITDGFRDICDEINELYPTTFDKDDWKWRTPFRTKNILIPEDFSRDELASSLEKGLDELRSFENRLEKQLDEWRGAYEDDSPVHLNVNEDSLEESFYELFGNMQFDLIYRKIERSNLNEDVKNSFYEILYHDLEVSLFEGFISYGKNKKFFTNMKTRKLYKQLGEKLYPEYTEMIFAVEEEDLDKFINLLRQDIEEKRKDGPYVIDELQLYEDYIMIIKDYIPGLYKAMVEQISPEYLTDSAKAVCGNLDKYYVCKSDKDKLAVLLRMKEEAGGCNIANVLLGITYYSLKEWQNAVNVFEESIKNGWPCFLYASAIHFRMGYAYTRLKEYKKAIEQYESASDRMPEDATTLNNLAFALYSNGEYERSLEVYKRCLKIEPDHTLAANNIIKPLSALKRYDELKAYIKNPPRTLWKDMLNLANKTIAER